MKSKTIILSSENNSGRAILTIFQEDDLLKCKIRLYNIKKLSRFCKLGIFHQDQVYSANLLEKSDTYTSSMVGDFDLDKDFYTAIVDTEHNNQVLLSGGTYAGFFFNDNSVFEENTNSIFDRIEMENPNTNIYSYENEQNTNENTSQSLPDFKEKTQSAQDKCEDCEKCKSCKYKEFFYSQQAPIEEQSSFEEQETTQPEPLTIRNQAQTLKEDTTEEEKQNTKSVIDAIVPQFEYVFENFPLDETLNSLIPNSKFVKISETNTQSLSFSKEEYSIGAIFEHGEMKYICYATFCTYNTPAPIELGEHYQWLPIDKEDPLSEGYYIVFQDAKDLKIVEL